MSFTYFYQCNEAISSENHENSINQEQQGFNDELQKPLQNENFWSLLKKNISCIDKCFSFLRCTSFPSLGSFNYLKQLYQVSACRNLVESCPTKSGVCVVSSPANVSRANPATEKLSLNNFLMILLCTCMPVPPPTKIMLCLPCPTSTGPAVAVATAGRSGYGSRNRCEVFPFGVPQKLPSGSPHGTKAKYLPPPEKRICPPGCLHVSELKSAKPCVADEGLPCIAHCFESAVAVGYLMLKLLKIQEEKTSEKTNQEISEEISDKEDDEVTVKEASKLKDKFKKRKRKKDKETMKSLRLRPNFFIGFQIYDAGIHRKVKKLQEEIITKNPRLYPALINVSTLHVTLAVTHLANEKDIKRIKEKLDEWTTKNINAFFGEPCILSFSKIKTFNNTVAYVDIEPSANKEKLFDLSTGMNDLLSSAGFTTDRKSFTPHVTILKLSKDFKLLKNRKSFLNDFETLQNCTEHFGKQEISTLQLLSMDDPKDTKGYYKCYHQIYVSDPKIEVDHSECCSPIPKPEKGNSDKC